MQSCAGHQSLQCVSLFCHMGLLYHAYGVGPAQMPAQQHQTVLCVLCVFMVQCIPYVRAAAVLCATSAVEPCSNWWSLCRWSLVSSAAAQHWVCSGGNYILCLWTESDYRVWFEVRVWLPVRALVAMCLVDASLLTTSRALHKGQIMLGPCSLQQPVQSAPACAAWWHQACCGCPSAAAVRMSAIRDSITVSSNSNLL